MISINSKMSVSYTKYCDNKGCRIIPLIKINAGRQQPTELNMLHSQTSHDCYKGCNSNPQLNAHMQCGINSSIIAALNEDTDKVLCLEKLREDKQKCDDYCDKIKKSEDTDKETRKPITPATDAEIRKHINEFKSGSYFINDMVKPKQANDKHTIKGAYNFF